MSRTAAVLVDDLEDSLLVCVATSDLGARDLGSLACVSKRFGLPRPGAAAAGESGESLVQQAARLVVARRTASGQTLGWAAGLRAGSAHTPSWLHSWATLEALVRPTFKLGPCQHLTVCEKDASVTAE